MKATDAYLLWYVERGQTFYCPGIAWADFPFFDIGGDVLREYITIFDRAHSRPGFAPFTACR